MKTDVILHGCAPLPLAHYLKALGVLRLVSEQCDPLATALWRRDVLRLSSALDTEALVTFLLDECKPTPIITPWNGGGGFFYREGKSKEKDAATGKLKKTGVRDQETAATRVIAAIIKCSTERFAPLRHAILGARAVLDSLNMSEAPKEEAKADLLLRLRNTLSDDAVGWLDAVIVVTTDRVGYPPLFGTGGTDGNLDFTNNFIQRLTELIDPGTGQRTKQSEQWLRQALFANHAPGSVTKAPIGQFFPAAAGGANNTSGFDGDSAVNPWDYVLMIEGSLLFAAAAVKKLDAANERAGLAWPFAVRSSGVGYGSAAVADQLDGKSLNEELWMPIWNEPTTLSELRAIFSEGRAQVRGRAARSGVDFAMAVVTLGVDRGISAFQRYGFLVRNGLSNFATPLERVVVQRNARADLLADIDQWLDRVRQKAGPQANPAAPASVSHALNQLERSILDLCRDDSADRLQAVLIALGRAERALARSFKWTTGDNTRLRALHQLNPDWLKKAATDCAEFRLAAALAGSRAWLGKETLWLRQHLEPLTMGANLERSWLNWDATPGNDVVWHEGELVDALNAILARRMVRVDESGARGWPDWSPRAARLDDITQFIEGRTDAALLADLLWGLSLIDWEKIVRDERAARKESGERAQTWTPFDEEEHRAVPSSLYALLRLCLRRARKDDAAIPLVPAIHLRAAQGQGAAASEIAARRLRGSGYAPLVTRVPVEGPLAQRTAAALLFPISDRDFRLLERSILHQLETNNL